MNRSIVLAVAVAALGLTACTSSPPDVRPPDAAPTSSDAAPTSSAQVPPTSSGTTVGTEPATKPVPPPPAKPVIDSFGFGDLKLGMTRQQALDAKLIGPAASSAGGCTYHELKGTVLGVWVSPTVGVASIPFSANMTSDGAGTGATEEKLKAEYTNLVPAGPNYSYTAAADGNPNATFTFSVDSGKVTVAFLSIKSHDCHN